MLTWALVYEEHNHRWSQGFLTTFRESPPLSWCKPLLNSRIPYGRLQHPLTITPLTKCNLYIGEWLHRHPCCDLTTATKPQGKHEGTGSPAGSPAPSSSVPLRGPRCHYTSLDILQWSSQLHQQQQQHLIWSKLLDHAAPTPVVDPYTTGNGHGRTLGAEQPKALSSKTQNVKAVAALPVEKKHALFARNAANADARSVLCHGPCPHVGFATRVPVFSAEPSGLCHLHVSSQGRLLPTATDEDEEGSCAASRAPVRTRMLRALVLHVGRFISAALLDVLFARHGLRQAFAEVLRQHQPPRLPLQKHPGLQGGRGQGLSAGKTGLMMACQKQRVQSDSWAKFTGPSPIAVVLPKTTVLKVDAWSSHSRHPAVNQ